MQKKSKVEHIKEDSDGLRGSIAEELASDADHVSDATTKLLKFHGTYEQDNRDTRKDRRKQGLGKEYIFMVRNRIPGGKITADQFLGELDIADELGNGTLRITTRQGIQLHGVVKSNLWSTIHRINEIKLSTQSACGDVERNVVCCPAPLRHDGVRDRLQECADAIADHLRPRTRAYHEIWIQDPSTGDRQQVIGHTAESRREAEDDPIYGKAYLPRKFKTGIGLCDDNCIDVYDQDVGLLAITRGDSLVGFNVLVGGGMGTTPSDDRCFPALAKPMAFVQPEHLLPAVTAVVLVQRDFGNRADRRQARMKYLIHNWGLPKFKAKVEEYLPAAESICGVPEGTVSRPLPEPDPADVHGHHDHLGWHDQGDGRWFLGLPIENGRVKDEGEGRLKSALREIFGHYRASGRLTAQQNLLLCDLDPALRPRIEQLLADHGVATVDHISNVRRLSFACPALPTCGLAITESERVMPAIVSEVEAELSRLGLANEQFTVRMTGCPNGCTRPYNADVGLVGRSVDGKSGAGKYSIFVGGNRIGTRMNAVYKDLVPLSQIVSELRPLLLYFKQGHQPGESLGDFCHRIGIEKLLEFDADFRTPASRSSVAWNTHCDKYLESGQMNYEQRIDEYAAGPELVRQAVAGMTEEQLDAAPVPGKWSTRQVVCHIADFEPVYAQRMKRVIAESEPTIFGGDPDLFAARLAYEQRSVNEELALIEAVRRHMTRILRSLDDDEFQRVGHHSEAGPLTLATLLDRITQHIPHHVRFIEEKRKALA